MIFKQGRFFILEAALVAAATAGCRAPAVYEPLAAVPLPSRDILPVSYEEEADEPAPRTPELHAAQPAPLLEPAAPEGATPHATSPPRTPQGGDSPDDTSPDGVSADDAAPDSTPQTGTAPEAVSPDKAEAQPLALREVTESVYYAYPGLEAALREMEIAAGQQQAALGEFDLKLKAGSQNDVLGFYQTYKQAIKVEQAMWNGGSAYGQYRLGRGKYPTWDGLETNDGGEFKVGFLRPLLQNSAIDRRRADIFQATLRRQQVEPAVQALLLELVRDAQSAYWEWVAAGRALQIQRELLRITVERNRAYESRVKEGDLPRIELVQNERLIASREVKLIEAERKLQNAAIKLSLYLRDEAGQPLIPGPERLPADFPAIELPELTDGSGLVTSSLANRPELRELDVIRQQIEVELLQAQNMCLPELNATLDAAQDVGGPTPKRDKTPFQLQAGLYFDVPLERNKAQGKIRESQAKLAQLAAKRRLLENKITIEVQDAISALTMAQERYLRAKENRALAEQLVIAERQRFDAQDSDLLRVAIQEAAAIEAAIAEIEALVEFFQSQSAFGAVTAADPLAAP